MGSAPCLFCPHLCVINDFSNSAFQLLGTFCIITIIMCRGPISMLQVLQVYLFLIWSTIIMRHGPISMPQLLQVYLFLKWHCHRLEVPFLTQSFTHYLATLCVIIIMSSVPTSMVIISIVCHAKISMLQLPQVQLFLKFEMDKFKFWCTYNFQFNIV